MAIMMTNTSRTSRIPFRPRMARQSGAPVTPPPAPAAASRPLSPSLTYARERQAVRMERIGARLAAALREEMPLRYRGQFTVAEIEEVATIVERVWNEGAADVRAHGSRSPYWTRNF